MRAPGEQYRDSTHLHLVSSFRRAPFSSYPYTVDNVNFYHHDHRTSSSLMSATSSAFSGRWYNDTMASGPGKLELPLVENEPLGIFLGSKTEKCELRIEG
jgi:hypothetical protein